MGLQNIISFYKIMLTISNNAGSLGDYLSLTPLFNHTQCTVQIFENERSRELSKVYDGLADIEFVNHPVPPVNQTDEEVCFSQRILNYYKAFDQSPIPKIKITKEEEEWATEFLSKYKNPICFNRTVGKPDTGHPLAKYRQISVNISKQIISQCESSGYTVLNFCLSSNYEKISNEIPVLDLPIRKLAACFYKIKKYIGSDTGDYHLMLSVGGNVKVLVPPSDWHYDHKKHLYLDYAWKNEPKRADYYLIK